MARLLVLLVSLAILSAASGSRLLRQTKTTSAANNTMPAAGPAALNAPTSSPAIASTGNTTAAGNTTTTGPFAAAIAAAGVPYNVSIITQGLDGALAGGWRVEPHAVTSAGINHI